MAASNSLEILLVVGWDRPHAVGIRIAWHLQPRSLSSGPYRPGRAIEQPAAFVRAKRKSQSTRRERGLGPSGGKKGFLLRDVIAHAITTRSSPISNPLVSVLEHYDRDKNAFLTVKCAVTPRMCCLMYEIIPATRLVPRLDSLSASVVPKALPRLSPRLRREPWLPTNQAQNLRRLQVPAWCQANPRPVAPTGQPKLQGS